MSAKSKKGKADSRNDRKKDKRSEPEPDRIYAFADNLLFALVLLILFLRGFLSGRTYPHYNHFFHIAVCMATILWLVKSWRRGTLELNDRLLTGFALAFVLVCSITFFTTIDKGITLRYIYEIITYTLLFLVIANNFRDRASIKAGIFAILSAGIIINIYGVYQRYVTLQATRDYVKGIVASGNQDLLNGLPLNSGILYRLQSARVFSTFLYPNAYGFYLALSVALAIGLIWSMREEIEGFVRGLFKKPVSAESDGFKAQNAVALIGRWFFLALCVAPCVLIPWNLWLTGSRGGWLSTIAILFVLAAAGLWGRKKPVSEKVAAALIVVIVSAALLSGGAVYSAEPGDEVTTSFMERLTDSVGITQRFTYWKAGLEMVKDSPWLGVGSGAFEAAYPRYMILGGYPVKLAHNNYVQVWAETGTIGLNAFVGMWLVFLYSAYRKARPGAVGDLRGIACGLGAGGIGFLVNSLVDFALYLPPLMYFVYAIMGFLVAIPSERTEGDKFTFRFSLFAGIGSIVAVCVFLGIVFESYQGLRISLNAKSERNKAFPTEYAREKGIRADPARQHQTLREITPLLKESIRHFPYDSETRHILGDVYLQLFSLEKDSRRLDEGVRQLKRAGELSPYSPYVFSSLAMAYWMMGNATGDRELFQKGLEAQLRASENFPVNPEFHEKLRQMYVSLGDKKKANEENLKKIELKKHYKVK